MSRKELRERREAIVNAHVEAENRHDVEGTIATFAHPRYEVNGEVRDGEGEVRELWHENLAALPDLHIERTALYHADDAVIEEVRITGTHDGPWAGIPATGRPVDFPLVGIFEFEEDRLICEKIFFDSAAILRQVGVLPDESP